VPCSVAASSSSSQPPSQHYTVLDPNEVQKLLPGAAVCGVGATSGEPGPLSYGGASFQFMSSDDVASCASNQDAASGCGGPSAGGGSSCNEIPLRPARESSQPRIDAASSGSSGNSWP